MSSGAAAAFVREAVARHGRPLGGSLVALDRSQAQLAAEFAKTPATVAWYLRQLGPAVVQTRPGVVVDEVELATAGTGTAPLGRGGAPRRLALAGAGGADRPPSPDPPGVAGAPPGTGVPSPPVAGAEAARNDDLVALVAGMVEAVAASVAEAAASLGRLVELQERLVGLAVEVVALGAGNPREPRATTADSAAGAAESAGTAAEVQETDRLLSHQEQRKSVCLAPPDSASRGNDPRNPRERPAVPADSAGGDGTPGDSDEGCPDAGGRPPADGRRDWTGEDLERLVEPLVAEARRLRLPQQGPTHRPGFEEALAPYRADQVAHAVAEVKAQLRRGDRVGGSFITKPFGLLVRAAREGDGRYFPAVVPAARVAEAAPVRLVEEEEDADPEAAAAVAAAEDAGDVAALGRLDEEVRAFLGRTRLRPERMEQVLADPEARGVARREAWRRLEGRRSDGAAGDAAGVGVAS